MGCIYARYIIQFFIAGCAKEFGKKRQQIRQPFYFDMKVHEDTSLAHFSETDFFLLSSFGHYQRCDARLIIMTRSR